MLHIPHLYTDNEKINRAFRLAMATLVCNTAQTKDGYLLNAGWEYPAPWVRDSSINVWNGAGLLMPEVSRATLLHVIRTVKTETPDGTPEQKEIIGEAVGQNWDVVIWILGAWQQYLFTGDREFLEIAHRVGVNTITLFEREEYDSALELFRGPACYGDGVAAYPDRYAVHGESGIIEFSIACRDQCVPEGVGIPMYTLSTNCLFYAAYRILDRMAEELGIPSRYSDKASALHDAINRTFYSKERGRYAYLVDTCGVDTRQEGLGVAFAMLFGIADGHMRESVLKNLEITPHGVACVYPSYERYTAEANHVGRHSGTVWPFVEGFMADAFWQSGRMDLFEREFTHQTENALEAGGFFEIFHPNTGEPYGGLQEDHGRIRLWRSMPMQTWSATAYLRGVLYNLFGMRFAADGIHFSPAATSLVRKARLSGLIYQGAVLDLEIETDPHTESLEFYCKGEPCVPWIGVNGTGKIHVQMKIAETHNNMKK